MFENLIVFVIVVLAALYVGRMFFKSAKRKQSSCGCGCASSCDVADTSTEQTQDKPSPFDL